MENGPGPPDINHLSTSNHVATQDDHQDLERPISPTLPVSPPYWHVGNAEQQGDISTSLRARLSRPTPGLIVLEDHTDENSDQSRACWAKSARIVDSIVIGSRSGVGALGSYVVFNCAVETANGSIIKIRKRYSEFDTLRSHLVQTYPNAGGSLPKLPPKSVLTKFDSKFLEKRRVGLQHFLNCVILNPEFSASPILKDFLFA